MSTNEKVIAPLRGTPIDQVRPSEGFAYLAGYTNPQHNLPAMFAYGYPAKEIVIVARGVWKIFLQSEFDAAIACYKEAMKINGYEV